MSNEDKNVSGYLVLDIRKWWRQVQAKNCSWSSHNFIVLATVFSVQWSKIAMRDIAEHPTFQDHIRLELACKEGLYGEKPFAFEFTPRVSLSCKLVPVHYREYGLLYFLGTYTRQKAEKMYSGNE